MSKRKSGRTLSARWLACTLRRTHVPAGACADRHFVRTFCLPPSRVLNRPDCLVSSVGGPEEARISHPLSPSLSNAYLKHQTFIPLLLLPLLPDGLPVTQIQHPCFPVPVYSRQGLATTEDRWRYTAGFVHSSQGVPRVVLSMPCFADLIMPLTAVPLEVFYER